MADKPVTQEGYGEEVSGRVRAVCLDLATRLGDLLNDIVVVGGLVPSLLVDQENLPPGLDRHVGTTDLDIGLALAILDEDRYRRLSERLRSAALAPDVNEYNRPTLQRWTTGGDPPVLIDFLIPPSQETDEGGRLRYIESDFAAFIAPGLQLAFRERLWITLSGLTPSGEQATRKIPVCGPGAFTVLKALAFRGRGENKDAYDFYYVLCGFGPEKIAQCLVALLPDTNVENALAIIEQDFTRHDGIGPRRTAMFLPDGLNDAVQADVVGQVLALLRSVRRLRQPDVPPQG